MDKDAGELVVFPLYSSLTPSQQRKIFSEAPGPKVVGGKPGRKVVVSTNIAVSFVYVVDVLHMTSDVLESDIIFGC